MTTDSPTLSELSDDFLEKQARVNQTGEVETEVNDVTIYPLESGWILTISCGKPFENSFAKITLGDSKQVALNKILSIYPIPFENLSQLTEQSVHIDLDSTHKTNDGPPRVIEELENPVTIEGFKGHISPVYRSTEHYMESNEDIESIQREIEKDVILYRAIQNTYKNNNNQVTIEDIHPVSDTCTHLYVSFPSSEAQLPIELPLPSVNNISDHPTTDFITQIGCGKLENLEGELVYLYKTDHSSVVGVDTRFNQYGLSPHRIDETDINSNGIISKLVGKLL